MPETGGGGGGGGGGQGEGCEGVGGGEGGAPEAPPLIWEGRGNSTLKRMYLRCVTQGKFGCKFRGLMRGVHVALNEGVLVLRHALLADNAHVAGLDDFLPRARAHNQMPGRGDDEDRMVACHTSHVTRHTSHVTRHTSHVTRHTSHVTHYDEHNDHDDDEGIGNTGEWQST